MTPNETEIVNRVRAHTEHTMANKLFAARTRTHGRISVRGFLFVIIWQHQTHKMYMPKVMKYFVKSALRVDCMHWIEHAGPTAPTHTQHQIPLCVLRFFGFTIVNFSRHSVWLTCNAALSSHCAHQFVIQALMSTIFPSALSASRGKTSFWCLPAVPLFVWKDNSWMKYFLPHKSIFD